MQDYFSLFKEIWRNNNTELKKDIDQFKLKGIFSLKTIDKEKNIVDSIYQDNIIVNTSFDIIFDLFVNGGTNSRINTLKLGDGGIYNSIIKTPLPTETDLYHPVFTAKIPDVYTDLDILKDTLNRSIVFKWHFDETEANTDNGATLYSEAGLFSESGIMFSKKNFTEVLKNPEKQLIVEWTIKIV